MSERRLRIAVVDDEPLARQTIRLLLAGQSDVEVVMDCGGAEAVERVGEARPDLLFLDVQMPEVDGFQVLEALPEDLPVLVVFVTAYDRYALDAFQAHAVDYLLKPFDDARFQEALGRARQLLAGREAERQRARLQEVAAALATAPAGRYLRRFVVRAGGRVLLVRTSEVDWIEAADYYASLHVGRATHLVRLSLAALEGRLDPQVFFRIHRSAIVNLDRIRELHPHFRGEYTVVLQDGTELRLGRGRWEELQRRLSE